MKALDTNLVVRFLVCDDAPMTARARTVFERARDGADPVLIANLAMLETLWGLGSAYGFTRETNIKAVGADSTLTFDKKAARSGLFECSISFRTRSKGPVLANGE